MASKDFWIIKIPNWDKHNAKQNRQKYYLMDRGMHKDPQFLHLSSGARLLWLWLLGEVAGSTKREAWLTAQDVERITSTRRGRIELLVRELCDIEWIQVVSRQTFSQAKVSKDKESKVKVSKGRGPTKTAALAPPTKVDGPSKQRVIAAYCDAWRDRYQSSTNPPIGGKEAGQLGKLCTDHGEEKSIAMIWAYLSMPDSWYVTKRHDIPTLLGNLNAVVQFMDSGRMITRREANQLDLLTTNKQTLDALDRGEV